MEGCDLSAKISKIAEFFRRVCFKSILLKCMQNSSFFVPHAKMHLSKMKQTLLKIDFFEKKFEKILKVQKFLWSRSGRNFCRQGRTPQCHNFSNFESWKNPCKIRKVMIIWRGEAFEQKPHFWSTWWRLTLRIKENEDRYIIDDFTFKNKLFHL